ncbi:MAG: thioredoxin-disulfide reductase [Candidatus Marinimicrobia bacterium]|nr:thioredoxin-disulfide reductase [Candidatus Neomarinimicrobiota bacterium]
MSEQIHKKVIIIGSGPAGLTAAIYAARADLSPIIFEGDQPGGQLTTTNEVENYPGFVDGITGPDLMDVMRKQAVRFGAESKFEYVTKVDFSAKLHHVWVGEKEYTADTVIIATGASARYLGLPSEEKLKGFGVSACATCDGFFYRDKEVFVVGGGDSALEEAGFLTKFASKVYLIHRRDEFRGSKIMRQRVLDNPKVEVLWNTTVDKVLGEPGEGGVVGAVLKDTVTGETREQTIDGIFMAIGHKPNTDIFKEYLRTDETGYLITRPDSTATDIPGVFAAGDVRDHVYRQAITAAGNGCMAALEAERYITEKEL